MTKTTTITVTPTPRYSEKRGWYFIRRDTTRSNYYRTITMCARQIERHVAK